jgi:putative Mn2+ efflux pump MntP
LEIIEILLIAFGLAMDAFAVSLSAAATGIITSKRAIFRLSFHFGLFQFLMPLLGWFAGARLIPLISSFDHWIAFFLLQFVAIRMIFAGVKENKESFKNDPSRGSSLVMLSVATSIDALSVGFSLAMVNINIWYPSAIIGLVTAILSIIGIRLGNLFSQKLGKMMEIVGGIILSGVGIHILIV